MTKLRPKHLQVLHSGFAISNQDPLHAMHPYWSLHGITHLLCSERHDDAIDLLQDTFLAETILEHYSGSALGYFALQITALLNQTTTAPKTTRYLIQAWKTFCRSLIGLIPSTLHGSIARHRLLQLGLDLPDSSPLRQMSEEAWNNRGSIYPMYSLAWESSDHNISPALLQRFALSIEHLMACTMSLDTQLAIVGGGNCWWTPNGQLSPGDCNLKLLRTKTGEVLQEMQGHQAPIIAVTFAIQDTVCISASLDGSVRWWDVSSGQSLAVYVLERRLIQCLTAMNDIAFMGFNDGTLLSWRLNTPPIVYAKFNHSIVAITHHTESHSIWVAVLDDGVYHIDQNGSALKVITCDNVCALSVHSNGEILAIGTTAGEIIVYHHHEIWRANVAPDAVGCLYIDRDFVWVGCQTGTSLRLKFALNRKILGFSLQNGQALVELTGHNSNVVGLSGSETHHRLISIGHDGTCIMWKPELAKLIDQNADNMDYINDVIAADTWITTVSDDGSIRVWDPDKGGELWKSDVHAPQPAIWVFKRAHVNELVSVDSAGNAWRWSLSGELLASYPCTITDDDIECTGATLSYDGTSLLRFIDGPTETDCFVFIDNLDTKTTRQQYLMGAIKSIQKFIAPIEDDQFLVLSHQAEGCGRFILSTGECTSSTSIFPRQISYLTRGFGIRDYLIGTEDGLVFHWDLTHNTLSQWANMNTYIKAIKICPSSHILGDTIMVSDTAGVITWLSPAGQYETSWAHPSWSSALAVRLNGDIALACSDGILRTLRLRNKSPMPRSLQT